MAQKPIQRLLACSFAKDVEWRDRCDLFRNNRDARVRVLEKPVGQFGTAPCCGSP
jgi:hypothetical protein